MTASFEHQEPPPPPFQSIHFLYDTMLRILTKLLGFIFCSQYGLTSKFLILNVLLMEWKSGILPIGRTTKFRFNTFSKDKPHSVSMAYTQLSLHHRESNPVHLRDTREYKPIWAYSTRAQLHDIWVLFFFSNTFLCVGQIGLLRVRAFFHKNVRVCYVTATLNLVSCVGLPQFLEHWEMEVFWLIP